MVALGRVNVRLIPGCFGAGEGHDVLASGLWVGRDVGCHVRLDLPFASLRHCCTFSDENDEYALEDTRLNHTCVNGRTLSRNEIVLLKDFDAIRLTKRSLPELGVTMRIFHDAPAGEQLRFLHLDVRDRRSSRRS